MSGNKERLVEKGPYDDGMERWCFVCQTEVVTELIDVTTSRDKSESWIVLRHTCLGCGKIFDTVKTIVR